MSGSYIGSYLCHFKKKPQTLPIQFVVFLVPKFKQFGGQSPFITNDNYLKKDHYSNSC